MPLIQYEETNFRRSSLLVIQQANQIITEYQEQGFDLTLRQLYYQFVARDLLPNTQQNYKRLGEIISKARRAGMVDWDSIVDRTRNLRSLSSWESPSDVVQAVAQQYRTERWAAQPNYVEVWFEKDALLGVFERVCQHLRLPYFSCRGYTSDSEVWSAAMRLYQRSKSHERIVVLHFGDHDPSGLDMTRDIGDRLRLFGFGLDALEVRRLALNMDQIEEYEPPPNPAKETDARFARYAEEYGDESWELDAMSPTLLAALVRKEVESLVDKAQWDEDVQEEQRVREELACIADDYDDIVADLTPSERPDLADDPVEWEDA